MPDAADILTGHWADLLGGAAYLVITIGYYIVFARGMRIRPQAYIQGRMNRYRHRWIRLIFKHRDGILAVQTFRNQLMSSSFLASTAILVDIGLLTLLGLPRENTSFLHGGAGDPAGGFWLTVNVVILIGLYSYNFFNFALCVRDLNYLGYLAGLYGTDDPDERESLISHLESLLDRVAMNYTRGLRGYFFGLPLFFWLLSPYLMLATLLIVLGLLYMRDHALHNLPGR
ncbi:MAG: DUF599 domain-containing protein [Planctomycetota bacterium]